MYFENQDANHNNSVRFYISMFLYLWTYKVYIIQYFATTNCAHNSIKF